MSGAFGWIRNDIDHGTKHRQDSGFASAFRAYQAPAPPPPSAAPAPPVPAPSVHPPAAIVRQLSPPTAVHTLQSTAENVIIVVLDQTGSMGDWRDEIRKRCATFFLDAVKYLGTDHCEMLFIAHGDARTDAHAVQVAQFGRGPELDEHLASFVRCGGGGQGTESQELVAYYLVQRVDTSTAQNVYCFFLTDEAGCDAVSSTHAQQWLGIDGAPQLRSASAVFARLAQRMHVFCVFCGTGNYDPAEIRAWWERMLHREHVLPLDDARRCVDVMLGTLATLAGQRDQFTADLRSRQLGTRHGAQNVAAVQQSIALVGGSLHAPPQLPKGKTPALLASCLRSTIPPKR
ncbi:hypothetical protein HY632_04225 [Candidatus Uhrbacteria bacterium]|nr:hypothetical protein [Candidatus Uhrbacteria bacterium]